MKKIREVKISFERLLEVWLSKLDANEEELVEEDLIWFNTIFDKFFKGNNLNEYINMEGRYEESQSDINDFSEILEASYEFSTNKPERWARLKTEEPNLFEHYKHLNDNFIFDTNKYNLIDIYFRTFKKLYSFSVEKDLISTKKVIQLFLVIITEKISIFEKDEFNSIFLLSDFYNVVLWNLFTEKEIKEAKPDEAFISITLFESVFSVYYSSLFKYSKVPITRRYLVNLWLHLNDLKKEYYLDKFMNLLSGMTLSISTYREIDLYEIRALLQSEDNNSDYYKLLSEVNSKSTQIVLQKDVQEIFDLIENVNNIKVPSSINKNIIKYFLNDEKLRAIDLYKFREIQCLVLECLGIIFQIKDECYFLKSLNILRRNEQLSNHLNFFPKSMDDILVWLILLNNMKFQMRLTIEQTYGYKFLNNISVFLTKDIVFDKGSLCHSLEMRGLEMKSSFLNSMRSVSNDILNGIDQNNLLTKSEKDKQSVFWRLLFNLFSERIQESETKTPLPSDMFNELISGIGSRYINRSLLYFLSKNLSPFNRMDKFKIELNTFVTVSDLFYRKNLIPDWYDSPTYEFTESASRYLVENEVMQFDYKLFHNLIPIKAEKLKRKSIKVLFDEFSNDCLFIFKNSFPDFWLKEVISIYKNHKLVESNIFSNFIFDYKTIDRNSELIIIPKSSMSVKYFFDGRFRNLGFHDKTLMWEMLDLGEGNEENNKYVQSIEGFSNRFKFSKEELHKRFWIRLLAKTKILVKNKDSILRYKLNPYGE